MFAQLVRNTRTHDTVCAGAACRGWADAPGQGSVGRQIALAIRRPSRAPDPAGGRAPTSPATASLAMQPNCSRRRPSLTFPVYSTESTQVSAIGDPPPPPPPRSSFWTVSEGAYRASEFLDQRCRNPTALANSQPGLAVLARREDETLWLQAVARQKESKSVRQPCGCAPPRSSCVGRFGPVSAARSGSPSCKEGFRHSSRFRSPQLVSKRFGFRSSPPANPTHNPFDERCFPNRLSPSSVTVRQSVNCLRSAVPYPGRNLVDHGRRAVGTHFSICQTNPIARIEHENPKNGSTAVLRGFGSIPLWITLIVLAIGSKAPIEGHNPSVAACKKLADLSTHPKWNDAEKHVWHSTCESRIAHLPKENQCKSNVRASVLEEMLLLRCYREQIGPRGVRIQGASVTNSKGELSNLDLSDGHYPWPLWLKDSKLESLNLERSFADRNISLAGSQIRSSLNLKDARIHGQLILDGVYFPYRPPCTPEASGNQNESNEGVYLQRLYVGSSLSMANACLPRLDLSSVIVNGSYQSHSLSHRSQMGLDTKEDETQALPGLNMKNLSVSEHMSLRNSRIHGQLQLWNLNNGPEYLELDGLIYYSIRLDGVAPPNRSLGHVKALIQYPWHTVVSKLRLADWIDRSESRSFQPYSQFASVLRSGGQHMAADLVWARGKFKTSFTDTLGGDDGAAGSVGQSDEIKKQQEQNNREVSNHLAIHLANLFGIDAIALPATLMLMAILGLAIMGAFLTSLSRGISRIWIWIHISIVWVLSKVNREVIKEELVTQFRDAGQNLGKIRIDADKMARMNAKDYSNEIRKWTRFLDSDPVIMYCPLLRVISDWRVHNAGVTLWGFWIPSLLPPRVRPESLNQRLSLRQGVPLKPVVLEIYHLVCWGVAAIIVAATLLIIHPRMLG